MDDAQFESYYGMTKDEAIQHYGVKGMRWGVIKKDDSSGSRSSSAKEPAVSKTSKSTVTTASKSKKVTDSEVKTSSKSEAELVAKFKSLPPPPTPSKKQQQKNLADNQAKFDAKFGEDPPGTEKKGWRPTPKQIAWGITGAVVVGGIAYGAYKYRTRKPGEAIPEDVFNAFVNQSKQASWGGQGFIKPSSYNQKEFTLPAGHTFHRISKVAEEGYRGATYATHNIDDYNRYLTAFRGELGAGAKLQHLTFQTKSDLKVPSLAKRLEVMHTVMQEMDAKRVLPAGVTRTPISPKQALDMYQRESGGSWNSPLAKTFFDALKKEGFGAIVDDMDAGVIGSSPLVVFATEMLSEKKASPITSAEILNAAKSLTEIDNRKTFQS